MPSLAKTAVVTAGELYELAEWERKCADAKREVAQAEKELSLRRLELAASVLGIETAEDLKRTSPEEIERRFSKRLEQGKWRLERGAPLFSFSKSNEGRYPSWAQLYSDEMGETAAARVRAGTPVTYSYRVLVNS